MTDKEKFDDFPVKPRHRQKKGRANVEKRGGAREVVKSLKWLSFSLVYWSGTVPGVPFQKDYLYRPVQFLIGEKLKGLSTGIYAVQLTYGPIKSKSDNSEEKPEYLINPLVNCIRITENLIAKTSRALQAALKYPRALPTLVSYPENWLDHQGVALNRAADALRASLVMGKDHPEALAVEETCLWLGPDNHRPSRRILLEKILSWITEKGDTEYSGKILAAVVLGTNRKKPNVAENLKVWNRLGVTLFRWPLDMVVRLKWEGKISHSDLSILKELNHSRMAPALWERVIGGKSLDIDFITQLSELNHSCSRLESEPHRRIQVLIHILNKTIRNIRKKVDEDDFSIGDNAEESENRIQFFARSFVPDYHEFINKQGLSVNIKEFSTKKTLDFAYWYGLGGHFPVIFFKNRMWRTIFSELKKDLHYLKTKMAEPEDLNPVITGMVIRMAGRDKREKSLRELTRWLNILRVYWVLNEDYIDPGALAQQTLETGWVSSQGDPSNLDRLCFLLSELGHDLLGHDLRYLLADVSYPDFSLCRKMMKEWMITMRVISRYGSLTPDQCRFVIDRNMVYSTRAVMMKGTPGSLKDYVQWLGQQDERWFDLTLHHRLIWARLFRLSERSLVKFLSHWAGQTVKRSGLSWVQMSQLLDGILQFCVCESNLEVDPYEPDDFPDERERQQFVQDNAWIMDAIIESLHIRFQNGKTNEPENYFEGAWLQRLSILSFVYYWQGQNYEDEKRLVSALLEHCRKKEDQAMEAGKNGGYLEVFPENRDQQKLAVLLSGGDRGHLLNFLPPGVCDLENPGKLLQGWEFIGNYPETHDFLLSQSKKIVHLPGVFGLLNLMATIRKLPERDLLDQFFHEWQNPLADDIDDLPHPLTESVRHLWKQFAGYQTLSGGKKGASENIQKIIQLPATTKDEYHTLLKKNKVKKLDESARKRLKKLSHYIKYPEKINTLINDKLSRLFARQVPQLKMEALEKGIKQVIQQHWKTMVKGKAIEAGDPDWDNALWLYFSIKKNRRILRRLLNQEARQDSKWIIEYPLNQKYLKALKKSDVDTGVWMQGFEKTWKVDGQVWKAYTETNPLKIFHMGNVFNTCLKVGGIHDYSVVANALEMNKRVLYLKNEAGKMLGRKLLLLREDGTLFGCHSYGSCDSYDFNYGGSPWMKIFFDLFCLELARKCKLKFPTKEDTVSEENFKMFSNWYFDGLESFDWWVTDRLASSKKKSKSLLASLYRDIEQHLLHDRYVDEDLFRLLIWLEDDLLPIIDKVIRSPLIEKKHLIYISRFTQGHQVKKIIRKNLD